MTIQPSTSLSEISPNGVKDYSLATNIFIKLHQATTEAKILQAGVEIIHQTLKCDRVVIYSMESASLGKITAEAVTPGYAQILNTTIEDPCFEARYIDKYQKGRVRAITNIREAGMSLCYIESLEKIDVKANLVVPLTAADNSLYGLLVMHQCSRTRQWQQSEIEFTLGIADWLMKQVAQQQAHQNLIQKVETARVGQQLMMAITQEIHGATSRESLLQIAVDQAKKILNCDRVVVYSLQDDSLGEIVAEATIPALAPILASTIRDPCFEYRYLEQYEQGRVRAVNNIYEAGMTSCYVDNLAKIGVRANLVAPINWDNGTIYGLLVAHHCFSFKDWQPQEIEYCQQIAFHTGLSLSKAKLTEESALVEMGLSELNKIRGNIDQAQVRIDEIDKPIQNSNNILVEVNNLHKLLEREINLLNQNSSLQTRKNTKLIQIIVRKLATVSYKLRQSLVTMNNSKDEARAILSQAKEHFDGKSEI